MLCLYYHLFKPSNSAYSVLVHSVALGIQLTRVVGVELFRRTSYGSRIFLASVVIPHFQFLSFESSLLFLVHLKMINSAYFHSLINFICSFN